MKTATELLGELLRIYDEPERGQYWLPMWVHYHQEEIRKCVEKEVEDAEHYRTALLLAHSELHIHGRTTNFGPVTCKYCVAAHDRIHQGLNLNTRAAIDRARGEGD